MSFSRETIEEIKSRLQNHTESHFEIPFLLRDPDIFELVEILKNRPDIRSLDLSGSEIDDAGAKKLTELQHLTHLDVRGAEFSNESALMLVLNLKNLVLIDLGDNSNLDDDLGKKILSGCVDRVVIIIDTPSMSMKMQASIRDHYKNLGKKKTHQEGLAEESGKDTASDKKKESENSVSRTTNIYAQLRLSEDFEEKKGFIPHATRKFSQCTLLKEPEEIKLGTPHQSHAQKATSVFNRWFSWLSKRNVVEKIENSKKDNINLIKSRQKKL